MAKQPRYKQYINITAEELGRMKGNEGVNELRQILSSLRRGISATKATFTRASMYSHALSQYEAESLFGLKPKERPSIKNLTRNQLIMEVVKAQKALTGKTSTLRGARLVQREMEQRLFGRGSTRHFTIEEQRQYWAVYNEFIRLHADMYYRLGSDQIQKLLAEQMWEDKKIATEDFDLGGALDRAYAYLEEWEDTHL